MNVDIRLKVTWYSNLKRKKLQRILGAAGPLAFIDLLIYTSMHRPTGNLTDMDEADIEIVAQWDGEKDKFVAALLELNFLEKKEKFYALHDWKGHNAYAADSDKRSKAASKAAKVMWANKRAASAEQCAPQESAMRDGGKGTAPSPSPSPPPKPLPSPPKTPHSDKPRGHPAVARWCELHSEIFNAKFIVTPVLAKHVKDSYNALSKDLAEFERRVRICFADPWFVAHKPGPDYFYRNINKYATEPLITEAKSKFPEREM